MRPIVATARHPLGADGPHQRNKGNITQIIPQAIKKKNRPAGHQVQTRSQPIKIKHRSSRSPSDTDHSASHKIQIIHMSIKDRASSQPKHRSSNSR